MVAKKVLGFDSNFMFRLRVIYGLIFFVLLLFFFVFPLINSALIKKDGIHASAIIVKKELTNYTGDLGQSWFYVAKTSHNDSIVSIHNSFIEFRNYETGDAVNVILIKDSDSRFLFDDVYDSFWFPFQGFVFAVIFSLGLYLMWMFGAVWFPDWGHDD